MHNLDRVLGNETFNETNFGAFAGEFNTPYAGEYQGEMDEMALAAELLSVANEDELDHFLGKLISGAVKGISNFAKSPAGQALGGALKQVAKQALPMVGSALGTMIPIPGVGTALGSMAGKAAASLLEAESSAMDGETRDFEMAQRFVRMAGSAAQTAATAARGGNPMAAAMQGMSTAVRAVRQAPSPQANLPFHDLAMGGAMQQRQSGRWVRRGNAIVIYGA